MQSIKNFLFPGWKKLIKVFAIFLAATFIARLLLEGGYSDVLSFISGIVFFILAFPSFLMQSIFGMEPSLINLLIIAIYWYFFACLMISIYENKKISNFDKFVIPIILIIIVPIYLILALQSKPHHRFDGRIISDMNQIRTAGEIWKGNHNTYAGVCTDNDVAALIAGIDDEAPNPVSCFAEESAYCVTVELNSGEFWCVDSNLNSYSSTSNSCTAKNKSCE